MIAYARSSFMVTPLVFILNLTDRGFKQETETVKHCHCHPPEAAVLQVAATQRYQGGTGWNSSVISRPGVNNQRSENNPPQ